MYVLIQGKQEAGIRRGFGQVQLSFVFFRLCFRDLFGKIKDIKCYIQKHTKYILEEFCIKIILHQIFLFYGENGNIFKTLFFQLAKYCDSLLKKSTKMLPAIEMDDLLTNVVCVLLLTVSFTCMRKSYQRFYSKDLSGVTWDLSHRIVAKISKTIKIFTCVKMKLNWLRLTIFSIISKSCLVYPKLDLSVFLNQVSSAI